MFNIVSYALSGFDLGFDDLQQNGIEVDGIHYKVIW